MTKHKSISQTIDGVSFQLQDITDCSFLKKFGTVFCVFDQNDSGNIGFGVQNEAGKRFFIKVAGALTITSTISPQAAIANLKHAVEVYHDLAAKQLIKLVATGITTNLYYLVFQWADGECLFDHWNFDLYKEHPEIITPKQKFQALSLEKKLQVAQDIFEFMLHVENQQYLAVDFYDASLMYDFDKQQLTICDVDLFQKKPVYNSLGNDYWGTPRMKAPEEYRLDASLDARTNVFTIGALFFHIFGNYEKKIIHEMRKRYRFIALPPQQWLLPDTLYPIVLQATHHETTERFGDIACFANTWKQAVSNLNL